MIAILLLVSGASVSLETSQCEHIKAMLTAGSAISAEISSGRVTEYWPVHSITCIGKTTHQTVTLVVPSLSSNRRYSQVLDYSGSLLKVARITP